LKGFFVNPSFIDIAEELELAGLVWLPEIGDEIAQRKAKLISVLVDPQGMPPEMLRSTYLWLPTVEQIVFQFEARQAILFHSGLELSQSSLGYKTVVQSSIGQIEVVADSIRNSMGLALRHLLIGHGTDQLVN
jgi:hypothetical protein